MSGIKKFSYETRFSHFLFSKHVDVISEYNQKVKSGKELLNLVVIGE